MKVYKLIISLSILFYSTFAVAQQIPAWSQYHFNQFIFNPALAGHTSGNALSLSARRQYTGLNQAFGTYMAAFQTRNEDSKVGGGFQIYNDQLGVIRTNAFNGTYAYHLPVGDDNTLSFGLGLNAIDTRFDLSRAVLAQLDDPYVALLLNEGGFALDGNFGAHFQMKNWGFGFASLQTLQNRQIYRNKINDMAYYNLVTHYALNISYEQKINDLLKISAFGLWRKAAKTRGQFDITSTIDFSEKAFLGVAYRDGFSVSFLAGVHVNSQFTLGYSFDLTTHNYYNVLGNTHEVLIRYDLGRKNNESFNKPIIADANPELEEQQKRIEQLEQDLDDLKNNPVKDTVFVKALPTPKIETEDRRKTIIVEEKKPTVTEEKSEPESGPFYVIAGTYSSKDGAYEFMQELLEKGITSKIIYDFNAKYHYVYLGKFTNRKDAEKKVLENLNINPDLWIKEIK